MPPSSTQAAARREVRPGKTVKLCHQALGRDAAKPFVPGPMRGLAGTYPPELRNTWRSSKRRGTRGRLAPAPAGRGDLDKPPQVGGVYRVPCRVDGREQEDRIQGVDVGGTVGADVG